MKFYLNLRFIRFITIKAVTATFGSCMKCSIQWKYEVHVNVSVCEFKVKFQKKKKKKKNGEGKWKNKLKVRSFLLELKMSTKKKNGSEKHFKGSDTSRPLN